MDELTPQQALAEIERTQLEAFTGQRLPLWYLPGLIACMTAFQILIDVDDRIVNIAGALVCMAALGALLAVLTRTARVRWTFGSWPPAALAAYVAWVLAVVALAVGVNTALFDQLGGTWSKAVAGLAAIAVVTATTRPVENLTIRLAQGRVTK